MDRDDVVRSLLGQRAPLIGYVRLILRDLHSAEDIFQEVMVLALQHADELNEPDHAWAWSRKTARYLALNELRKRHRRDVSLDAMIGAEVQDLLEPEWQRLSDDAGSTRVVRLQRCVERLSPAAKRLVHLRFAEGLDCGEVSARVEKPLNTVYVSLSRIYRTLATCMGSVAETP